MSSNSPMIRRISLVYWLIVLLGIGIILQIIRLQFNRELKDDGQKISYKEEILPAVRGNILAKDGRLLVVSMPFYEIRMNCVMAPDSVFNAQIGPLATELAKFFGDKSAEKYRTEIINERKKGNQYKRINTRLVNYLELQQLKKFPLFQRRGVLDPQEKSRREYPYNRLAYRTVGFINEEGKGVGVEESFDQYLRGIPGKRMVQRIPGSDWMPISSEVDFAPRDGIDVITTLDVDIQDAAESALRELLTKDPLFEGATAIVMETATGEIRAIANMRRNTDNTYDEQFNYAIGQPTEPGSTFKLATLICLLEDNHVTLETPINTENGRWRYHGNDFIDSHSGLGTISMQEVLEQSSNVGFAKTAVNFYGGSLNQERRFIDRLYAMNLNKPLGLQITGERAPTMHYPEKGSAAWSGLTLPMMAMGYGLELTPMQTLTFYNAVANNGKMVKPKFVTSLQNKQGSVEKEFPTEVINSSICSPAVIKQVQKALQAVVEKGTARGIKDSRYTIAGKTGTARLLFTNSQGKKVYSEDGYRKHQASFVGYFPAESPKYTSIVVLYSDKTRGNFYGATWAAPVFKKIADKLYVANRDWICNAEKINPEPEKIPLVKGGPKKEIDIVLNELNIPVKRVSGDVKWVDVRKNEELAEQVSREVQTDVLPSVVNMGLKDALFLLENMKLKVSFSGRGRVLKQTPEAGTPIKQGQQVSLEMGI